MNSISRNKYFLAVCVAWALAGCASMFLKVTSMAIHPESRDMYIVARDDVRKTGSMIFKAQALAPGTRMFSHQ